MNNSISPKKMNNKLDIFEGIILGGKDVLANKADPFSITSWIEMVKTVEGNDKFMKVCVSNIYMRDEF